MGPVCWSASQGETFEADLEASDEEWARREAVLRNHGEIDLGCNWEYDQGEDYLPCNIRVSIRFIRPHRTLPEWPNGVYEAYGRLINPRHLAHPTIGECEQAAEVTFAAGTDLRTIYAAAVLAGPRCTAQAAWRRRQLARRFRRAA